MHIIMVFEDRVVDEGLWTWLVMGLWQLWKRRNKFVFQGILDSVEHTINVTAERCLEWQRLIPNSPPYTLNYDPKNASIFLRGTILCSDAARDPISGKIGLGWFARSQQGLVFLAGFHFVEYTPNVDWAKLLAIKQALATIVEGPENLAIFSNSLQPLQLIDEGSLVSDCDLLAKDIRESA
ncbi:hypothetical protein Scep_006578 [Stephania cephalantha]|uniref:RNase H type-1 domain-containing protein n=1 Tax=Stephania cephalantha TaxID=152367 RepID=A0AAP0PP63_9MAGN